MGPRPLPDHRPPGDHHMARGAEGGGRQVDQPGRAKPIIQVLVDLITDDILAQGRELPRLEVGDRRVLPEPGARVRVGDL